jgi:DNA-binding transcriptional MerR regulator/methylmalonyl-CoA mutase cobalamin-binding subunit
MVPIAAVERDTGLSKDTLRVWERRYGFPQPRRDGSGERAYPLDQVDMLLLIKRLLDQGFRPGKVIGRPMTELVRLAEGKTTAPRAAEAREPSDELTRYLACVSEQRFDDLRRQLSQAVLRLGLARFILDVMAPLTTMVGDAWFRGRIQVFGEHRYTEVTQSLLRNAIATIPTSAARPRVLLTTFPQEPHGLGMLMAEAMFALEGARCVSLGVQTPLGEIAAAARAEPADIVALSFTPVVSPNQVVAGLTELHRNLLPPTEVWAGGSAPVLRRRPPSVVQVLGSLADIGPAVADWRTRQDRA